MTREGPREKDARRPLEQRGVPTLPADDLIWFGLLRKYPFCTFQATTFSSLEESCLAHLPPASLFRVQGISLCRWTRFT